MKDHRFKATVGGDGSITIRALPFAEGEEVEVIVRPRESSSERDDRPLRGSVRRYTDPFAPATDDWDATRGAA